MHIVTRYVSTVIAAIIITATPFLLAKEDAASGVKLTTGCVAPAFTLNSVDGKPISLSDYKDKVVVLEWFCANCPTVRSFYDGKMMQTMQEEYTGKGVMWLCIDSSSPKVKSYMSPDKVLAKANEYGSKCNAILTDPDGKIGMAYGAKTTPHIFIIDAKGTIIYQGAVNEGPTSADPKARNYLRAALDEVLTGKPVTTAQSKQYG